MICCSQQKLVRRTASGNYLKRTLKPIAEKASIPDFTYQTFDGRSQPSSSGTARRRTPRISSAIPNSKMTGWYMKQIPETVRGAVERMDADICRVDTTKPPENGMLLQ